MYVLVFLVVVQNFKFSILRTLLLIILILHYYFNNHFSFKCKRVIKLYKFQIKIKLFIKVIYENRDLI
jgi:hypothetical protein